MIGDLTRLRRQVSRSFDLSLRILPSAMRNVVSIAYLLARASDTLADTAGVPVASRVRCLDGLAREMAGQGGEWRSELARFQRRQTHAGERELLSRLDDCLAAWRALPREEAELVREVTSTILSGQRLDLERFGEGGGGMPDAAGLEDYCHRVAGCVGVFWTRAGFLTLGESFATSDAADLERLGEEYGRGLQLVNILRDVPEDLRHGRVYLPVSGDAEPEVLMAAIRHWIVRARAGLSAGRDYASTLVSRRLRAATVLPALLGEQTLDLVAQADWDSLQNRVKVGRATVWKSALRALCWGSQCQTGTPGGFSVGGRGRDR